MFICPKCGVRIYGEARRCTNCGEKLDASAWADEGEEYSDAYPGNEQNKYSGADGTYPSGDNFGETGVSAGAADIDPETWIPQADDRIRDARTRRHSDAFGGRDAGSIYASPDYLNDTADDPYTASPNFLNDTADDPYTASGTVGYAENPSTSFDNGPDLGTDYTTSDNGAGLKNVYTTFGEGEDSRNAYTASGKGTDFGNTYTASDSGTGLGNTDTASVGGTNNGHKGDAGSSAGRTNGSTVGPNAGNPNNNDNGASAPAGKSGKKKKKTGRIAAIIAAILVLCLLGSALSGGSNSSSGDEADSSLSDENTGDNTNTAEDAESAEDDETGENADTSENNGADSTDENADNSLGNSSGKTLIAEELSLSTTSGTTPDASSTAFQALDAYADTYLDYEGPSTSGTNVIYAMEGGSEAYDVVQEYVALLTDCMNFELVDSYEQVIRSTYFSYALEYTGTATVDVKNSMNYVDDVYGDVTLWGILEGDDLVVRMTVPNVMSAEDMGWRYGGTADVSPKGDSVTAGLYQLSDGSFETTDGRLSAALGAADVFVEGTETTGDASYIITEDSKEELYVENYYNEEIVYFTTGYENLETGDLYTLENLRGDHASMQQYNYDPSDFIMGTTFVLYHNGTWTYPLYSDASLFNELSFRVMYYEENVAAVFYVYAELSTSPATLELLAAVDLSDALAADNGGGGTGSLGTGTSVGTGTGSTYVPDCTACGGSGKCSYCGGDGYVYSYALDSDNKVNCYKCGGDGKCSTCDGSGKRY